MENIQRGVVAVRTSSDQVYIGWRMLGTDPSDIGFNVYRGDSKLNSNPITNSTNYVDNTTDNNTYHVRPVVDNQEQSQSETVGVWSENYLNVSLQRPSGGVVNGSSYTYSPNDCSVGDLDGDGEYEIIVKWNPSNAKDNSQSGYTGKVYLDAYELDGTHMWRIDLGWNIRAGAHYTQFIVYDLDSDGEAEVACKTADGTMDGQGNMIGDPNADYRNSDGYVLDGPEFLTVFNGQTGAAMATTNYVPARGNVCDWGDCYGNRVDRFLAGVGYFDGSYPSLLMTRGYYTRSVLVAWDWRDGQLTQRWIFDTDDGYSDYEGQGAHSLSIGDADDDGRDEVMFGAMAVDDDGSPMYNTNFYHGDATHFGDLLPGRPGLEFYMPHESAGGSIPGVSLRDAGSGGMIWTKSASGDIGRGMTADITSAYEGNEFWASDGLGVYNSNGDVISSDFPPINFGIWWDGDLLREMLDGTTISKWGSGTLFSPGNVSSNNGTKATPNLTADLFGDWREEVVFRTNDNQNLRIYTTTSYTNSKLYTLMHNPQYRVAVAWQNVAYNQPPHPSYFLGANMSTPPQPNIVLVGGSTPSEESTIFQENETGFCGVDGSVDSDNSGYTGSGFANTDNTAGNGIDWMIEFIDTDSHSFTFRYANGASGDRLANLIIDGATVASGISFAPTGSWTSWSESSISVNVSSGIREVRLEATGSDGLANIDYIEAGASSAPLAANCDGSPDDDIASGATYVITNRNSGQAMDVEGAMTNDGANVLQWPETGNDNQHWTVQDIGDGYYTLTAVHSGKVLDVNAVSTDDGANVHQWTYGGGNNQQFELLSTGDGFYTIVAMHSGKCVEVTDASTSDGANVQQWTCNGHDTQSWAFTEISDSRSGTASSERSTENELNQLTGNKLSVYPNPTMEGKLTCEYLLTEASDVMVNVLDVNGRVVFQKDLGTKEQGAIHRNLNLNAIPQGVYIFKLITNAGIKSASFIKN